MAEKIANSTAGKDENVLGTLPPREKATEKNEKDVIKIVKKDIQGFSHRPGDATFVWSHGKEFNKNTGFFTEPWMPIIDKTRQDTTSLLSEPISISNQTVILSSDGFYKDRDEPKANVKINNLANYAEKKDAVNELVTVDKSSKKYKEVDDLNLIISSTDNVKKVTNSYEKTYNYDTGKTFGKIDSEFQNNKYNFETKLGIESRTGEKGSVFGMDGENNSIGLFNYEATTDLFSGYKTDESGSGYGASADIKLATSVAQAEGTIGKESLVGAGASGSLLSTQATASGSGYVALKNGVPVVQAGVELGAEVNLVEAKGNVKAAITPYRAWNMIATPVVKVQDWMGWNRHIDYLDKKWDWGVWCKGEGSGQIGLGAKGEAKIQTDPPEIKIGVKGTVGLGAGVGANCGVQTPYN